MLEIIKKCASEAEVQKVVSELKREGYKRTQNCYWVEWYEKDEIRVVVSREF